MIITRTPFRISLAGGGSDLAEYYLREGYGAVVSLTIQRYMYIAIHPYFHQKIRLKYSKVEDVSEVGEIDHPILRECLRRVAVEKGVEIASFADIPAGTGLASSSAFAVGLLNALYAYQGHVMSKGQLARDACEIEIDILKEPIGKQDQYAVSYGSINFIRFFKDESVEVNRIAVRGPLRARLEQSLGLYYVGGERRAALILENQAAEMSSPKKRAVVRQMLELATHVRTAVERGEIKDLGSLLHEGWNLKKTLAQGLTNPLIDEVYATALRNGAYGGKLLGAGGAGFLLLVADDHERLEQELQCRSIPVLIDDMGSVVVYSELEAPVGGAVGGEA